MTRSSRSPKAAHSNKLQFGPANLTVPAAPVRLPMRYQISRWRAEFLDRDTERRYRSHVEDSVALHASRALLAWAVLWLFFWLE
ncbi:hypothetical protein T35B1_02579 [Salinisphaera shabanensis T35B1]